MLHHFLTGNDLFENYNAPQNEKNIALPHIKHIKGIKLQYNSRNIEKNSYSILFPISILYI